LYTSSSFLTGYAESVNDIGGLTGLNYQFGGDWCGQTGWCNAAGTQVQLPWEDGYIFAPGTQFGQAASTAVGVPYLFPSSPGNRPYRSAM